MGTVSKIDKVLAALKAERDVIDHAIAKIEAANATKPVAKVRSKPARVNRGGIIDALDVQ